MSNISKSYLHDASKHKPTPRPRYFKDERFMEKAPLGIVENWVDGQGNVVSLQLRKLGDVPDPGIVDRNRAMYRRMGWVEQHLCPLSSGATRTEAIKAELAKRPKKLAEACLEDPKVKVRTERGIEYRCGCAHVEWLIESRRDTEKKRRDMKRGARAAQLDPSAALAEATKAMTDLAGAIVSKGK